ncbi:hypothetical protein HS7_13480 [Sulfolobales archaeon HS-7]|nr:hypothetical protein HS7_13480 [Sulfolobales archaeon HS-7]
MEVQEKVEKWLRQMKFTISNTPNAKEYYNVTVSPPPPAQFPILQVIIPEQSSPFVLILMGVGIHPQHVKGVKDMNDSERGKFLNDIKYTLLRMNVDFTFIPPQDVIPQAISVSKSVYTDGLTMDRFFDVFTLVRNAGLYIITKFTEQFGNPPPLRGDIKYV